MNTILFSVPRKKEETVDKLLDYMNDDMPCYISKFHAEKWRIQDETVYTIYYEDYKEE